MADDPARHRSSPAIATIPRIKDVVESYSAGPRGEAVMKIVNTERVWRYHVRFGPDETAFLRGIGFLPPQPNTLAFPTDEADMWVTREELAGLDMIANAPASFRHMVRTAAVMLAQTEALWPGDSVVPGLPRVRTVSDLMRSPESRAAAGVSAIGGENEKLRAERDAAVREAERLRHGAPIEGDFVCPNAIECDVAKRALREVTPIVKLAQEIGMLWREQDGVNGVLLEALAHMTRPESES